MKKRELGNMLDSEEKNLQPSDNVLEVFVNGEYIGNADMANEQGPVQAIEDYLQNEGFSEYSISTQENEVNIAVNTNYNNTINNLKNNMKEYLNNQ